MQSLAVNSLLQNYAKPTLSFLPGTKPTILERTHFSGPSSGSGGHHHYHGSGGGGSNKKHGIALTALTLLAFLFFLNILQNCLQDHMDDMTPTQQVIIMQAREAEAEKRKGEDQLPNSTITESRQSTGPEETVSKKKEKVPIRIKTYDYSRKP